jgi:predicted dehydrogenase
LEAQGIFEAPEFVKVSSYEKRDHLFIEHRAFYNAILNNEKPVVSIEDGIVAVNLIEKVLQSVETGLEVLI